MLKKSLKLNIYFWLNLLKISFPCLTIQTILFSMIFKVVKLNWSSPVAAKNESNIEISRMGIEFDHWKIRLYTFISEVSFFGTLMCIFKSGYLLVWYYMDSIIWKIHDTVWDTRMKFRRAREPYRRLNRCQKTLSNLKCKTGWTK